MQKIIVVLLSVLCVLLMEPSSLFAQSNEEVETSNQNEVTFGIRGGLSYYSSEIDFSVELLGVSESSSVSSDSRFGFAAGIFSEIPISDLFSFQPELLFVQKGGKDGGDPGGQLEGEEGEGQNGGNLALNYLDLPLLARINLPVDGDFDPYITAGPSVGYLLSINVDETAEEIPIDPEEFYKSFNAGFVIGAGADIGSFTMDLRYDIGLTNIYDDTQFQEELEELEEVFGDLFSSLDASQKTSGFLLTVGYKF